MYKMRKHPGNSYLEYALVLGVFALGVGATLTNYDVLETMAGAFAANGNGSLQGNSVTMNALGTIIEAQNSGVNNLITPPEAGYEQSCFSSGLCVNIPQIAGGNTDISESSASLGGQQTHQFASVIEQIAQQLEASQADASLVALITQLANQGHKIGDKQTSLLEFTGESVARSELPLKLNELSLETTTLWNLSTSLASYLNNNPSAFERFPEAQSIIDFEVEQIMKSAIGVETYTYHDDYVDSVGIRNTANLTHQSANTICSMGGDVNSCTTEMPRLTYLQ